MAKKTPKSDPLSRIALKVGSKTTKKKNDELPNIIEFVEGKWGIGLKLFPVQRIILKAHYGIPLDDKKTFEVTDWHRERSKKFTEKTYLEYLFEEGRCNIREVIPGEERRKMVLSIGRRSGKCVTGDTLVLTDRGIQRIEDLGNPQGPEVQPLDIGVAQEGSRRSRSTNFYNGGVRETRRVTTRCGYRIEGTPNHRIRVMREDGTIQWRYLEDIQEGDQIAIHRGTNLWAEDYVACAPYTSTRGRKNITFPAVFNEDWGHLLGYLVGDGSWTIESRVEATVEHPETWEFLSALMEKTLGEVPKIKMDRRTENTGNLQVSSVAWRDFLHNIGWRKDCGRYNKRIPWVILRSPEPVVRAFLRGLFETDGGVESGGKTVSFSTASEQLAFEVQTLLANLGIIARKKAKWNDQYERHYFILTVRGLRSRRVFAEKVGFDSTKKMAPLLESLEASREGGDAESIPHQRRWCRSLLESVPVAKPGEGWLRCNLRMALGNTIKPSATDKLTYPRLMEAYHIAQLQGADEEVLRHFEEIIEADYFYDPVVTVEDRQDRVYDLVVPDGVSFVANAMTNHNTLLSSCIVAYEVYRLIHKQNPQKYYGLASSNVIRLTTIATSKEQASLLFNEVSGHVTKCKFFSRYKANDTQSYIRFQTPHDIEEYGSYHDNPKALSSLHVSFSPCSARGNRGQGNIVVVFDEIAHFIEQGGKGAEEVYTAVAPSQAAFAPKDEDKNPLFGPETQNEARMIMISSPLGKTGLFYQHFQMGFSGSKAAKNMLCIQAPTWEVNPTVPASTFEESYETDVQQFFQEFGADFSERTMNFFPDSQDVTDCIDKKHRPKRIGVQGQNYFMGFDLGLVDDASAMAICHNEGDKIVVDLVDRIKAGEGQYADRKRLEFDDVADWIHQRSRQFSITEGIFDQWSAIPLEQALEKKGLRQIHKEQMTAQRNSEIYQNLKSMIFDRKLVLYDLDDRDRQLIERQTGKKAPEHAPYLEEVLELQARYRSRYVIDVEAPKQPGKHDDMADALARAVWLASMYRGKTPYIAGTRNIQRPDQGGQPVRSYKEMVRSRIQRKLGGSHPQRMDPRRNPKLYKWYVERYSR